MTYKPLATVGPVAAAADTTGQNLGNLTNHFTVSVLNQLVPVFECYHIVITNVPGGAQCQVMIGTRPFSFTFPNGGTEWDPQQPMILQAGQEVYFLWNVVAATTPVPQVTMYFRYDPDLNPGI